MHWRSSLHFEAQEDLISKRSAELEKQRQSLQAFFDNELVGMVRRDIDNNYLDVNQRWIEMLGYPRSELLRLKPQDIIHPDDLLERQTHEQQLKQVRSERSALHPALSPQGRVACSGAMSRQPACTTLWIIMSGNDQPDCRCDRPARGLNPAAGKRKKIQSAAQ